MQLPFPDILASAATTEANCFRARPDTKASQPDRIPNSFQLVCSSLDFAIQAAAADNLKRVKIVAYTGGELRLPNYPYPVIVDGRGLEASRQDLPIIKDHGNDKAVGHSESVAITAATGLTELDAVLSGTGPAAKEVRDNATNGYPWQASIGASVKQMEFVDEGETVTVNGRVFSGPVYVARKTVLREVSIVALGADDGTSVTLAAALHLGASMNFEQWVKAKGFDVATLTAEQKTWLQAQYEAEIRAAATSTSTTTNPSVAAHRNAIANEDARIAAIRTHCADHPEIQGKAIREGWTPTQAELEVLRAARPTGVDFLAKSGSTEINASACFEAALCLQAGISESRVGKWFDQKTMNEAVGKDFRSSSIATLMFATIQGAGLHSRPGSVTDDTIRTALKADQRIKRGEIKASGFSTLSLSGVLGNVANKAMLNKYEMQEVVWRNFCAIRSLKDFKVATRYRLTAKGSMRKVGPTGELKHVGLEESSFTNQLDTFGCMITLTRVMQINDDLGAFLEMPEHLGILAAIRPEEAWFVLLLANASNFFSTGNKNKVTGASYTMTPANGLAGISKLEEAFSNQVNTNNKPIMVSPDRLLCGTSNYVAARNIYNGKLKITGKDQTEVADNEHAGKYSPYKSAFVNNTAVKDEDGAAITGQSSTLWFGFADPGRLAAYGMAFLNGNQVPTLESEDAEFDVLGIRWRCFHDFGVGEEDPDGAVMMVGA